ncbi:hypothetical protein [Spartinivicinus ruber]|uniref:hypothetical protein n=1 Tax=Spartinivicinus ruber TaxID=2683272 RepID=UPI0013D3E53A|nr:hypothetical protein [Spartinivicinus ruber]
MSFYEGLASTASKLLADKGAPVVLLRESGETFDPVNGRVTPGTTKQLKTSGVLTSFTKTTETELGGNIVAGDMLLVLSAEVEPLSTDKLLVNGEPWQIVRILPVNPAGTPISYKVQVRK